MFIQGHEGCILRKLSVGRIDDGHRFAGFVGRDPAKMGDERFFHCLGHGCNRNLGIDRLQIGYSGAYGSNAFGLKFRRIDRQVAGDTRILRVDQQRAMMQSGQSAQTERVAGKFETAGRDVIAACALGLYTETGNSADDHIEIVVKMKRSTRENQRKVQVSQVVENGAAAGAAAGQSAAFGFELTGQALSPGVLIPSNDNRVQIGRASCRARV